VYDCDPKEIKDIKEKYNKKIITALTIENQEDVRKYKAYESVSEIVLFDSKGYEKSMSFDHNLLNEVEDHVEKMIAGNIKTEDVANFKNKHYILDVSGDLENSQGVKDINKIDKFLNTVHNINS
jgi:phosphoribosylanthranilate isomerase